MRIFLAINLFLFIIPSSIQGETVLQCSAKPGCQIPQCDQAPLDWTKPGFNLDEHLQRNEFPITCVNKNAGKSENSGNLLPLVIGNVQDIRIMEANMKNIEGKVEVHAIKMKEVSDSGRIMSHQSTEIQELVEANRNKSAEIKDLREVNEKQSLEINELWNITSKQSREIEELRKKNQDQSSLINQQIKNTNQLQRKIRNIDLGDDKYIEDIKALKAEIQNLRTDLVNVANWHKVGNYYYKIFDNKVNYKTAKRNCEKLRARLASVGIRHEWMLSEIVPLLNKVNVDTWVGLNDIKNEDTFYWEDGAKARASSTPWARQEPSNGDGVEDCVNIQKYFSGWLLNDILCSETRKYLCEFEV